MSSALDPAQIAFEAIVKMGETRGVSPDGAMCDLIFLMVAQLRGRDADATRRLLHALDTGNANLFGQARAQLAARL